MPRAAEATPLGHIAKESLCFYNRGRLPPMTKGSLSGLAKRVCLLICLLRNGDKVTRFAMSQHGGRPHGRQAVTWLGEDL